MGVRIAVCGAVAWLSVAAPASADVLSDRAAAVLVFPKVVAERISIANTNGLSDTTRDTLFQIANTSDSPAELLCFYVDATSRCSVSESACDPDRGLGCPIEAELCLPNWTETDFRIILTPHQPLTWSAVHGMTRDEVPLDGTAFVGIGGSSNAGTAIPPIAVTAIAEDPRLLQDVFALNMWRGELKCVVVDEDRRAAARNVLIGKATIETVETNIPPGAEPVQTQFLNEAQYDAEGIQAIEGDANGDGVLEFGGEANEYNACANVLVMDHFFDFAANPVHPIGNDAPSARPSSELTLVPCTEDIRNQAPVRFAVQYLVFNEFEQRFSTSSPLSCFFQRQLSLIDTVDPSRSIFSAFVAGTMTGQTRIRGVGGGLIGVLEQSNTNLRRTAPLGGDLTFRFASGLRNLHRQGERQTADRLILP